VFSLADNVLSISGELEETGLRVYVVDRTDRLSFGELSVIGTSFSGDIQLPNGNDRTIAIQAFDGANNSATSLFKIVGGAIEPYNPPTLDLTSLNPYYSYSFVAQTGDFPEDGSSVDNTQSQISGFGTNDALEKTASFNSSGSIVPQSFSTLSIELQNTEPPVPPPVAIGFIKPEVSINDLGQIAFIGDGAASGFTESWLDRTIKKDTIFVASDGSGVKDIAPNMIKSTFANPNYGFLPDPSIATFLLNKTARNPARYFDKFSETTISAGLSNREYAGGVQINNNGEVLVRRIERADGPIMLMAYYLTNVVGPSFLDAEYVSKPYSFIEKWNANTTDTVTPVAQGFVPLLLLNDLFLALSGLTGGLYGGLQFGAAPILRTYWPDYYGLLSNPSFNNNGDTVFNGFLEGSWHPTASKGFYTAIDSPGSTKPGAPTIFTQQQYDPATSAPRFWMADNGTMVRYYQNKIELLDDSLDVIKEIPPEFSSLGQNPRISDDGTVIAFYGNLSEGGAEKYQTTPGEGIFAYRVEDGAIERIAGISGNGYLDQGEIWEDYNENGTLDQGEDKGIFSGFDPDSPVGVNTQNIGYTVVYIGFDKQNNKGLYSTNFGFSNDENQLLLPSLIIEQGNGISDVAIYDPININGDIAFWFETEDGRDAVMKAEVIPSIGIDRWWATVNDDPIVVNLYISVPEKAEYLLDIDIENFLFQKWDLKSEARVIINGEIIKSISFDGTVSLGELAPGRYQLTIDGFEVPSEPIVEEISFTLQKGYKEIDKLVTKFVADHPEPNINLSLISQYAPILLFEQEEKYDLPLDPDGYNWDEKLQRQKPNQDKPVRLGDAETIVNLNPDSLQSSPTIFATLLEQNGEIAITYYFHYAKSNWADYDGANTHDGDWEGVTVFLKNGEPDRVAFNQHTEIAGFFGSTFTNEGDGGTTYRWEYLDFDEQTGRPKVYVGLGGHASYSKGGTTTWFPGNVESHSGKGETVRPNVKYLPRVGNGYISDAISTEDGKAQEWLLFPGKWGEQDKGKPFFGFLGGDDGIEGPVFQELRILKPPLLPRKLGERWLNPWSFTKKFDIPLIAQDDAFNIRQQNTFVFNKEDFLANDNYNEERNILLLPDPKSKLSGRITYSDDKITYELPSVIDANAEFIMDSFEYVLLDYTLIDELVDAGFDIRDIVSTTLNPAATLFDKIDAFLTLVDLLADPPALLSSLLGEEVDLIGKVEVTIERSKLSINNITVVEGLDNTAILTVTVDKPCPEQITVDYTTAPISATADLDYTSTTGTLIIPANTSTATITIPILTDDLNEEEETFAVNLSNPVNAILTNNQGIVTIIDAKKLSINNITVIEGQDSNAILTVTVNNPSSQQISVDYITEPSSATADVDYISKTGTLTIPANTSTATITIPILDDDLNEEEETFAVNLSNPINAILTNNQGIVTIIDNDDNDDNDTDNIIPIETPNNKYVKVVIPKNQPLTNIEAIANPSPSNAPANINFPVGFFAFDIPQISQGSATTFTLYLPDGSTANAYWKYGATPDNPNSHWYNFSYDPITKTGATFQDINGDGQNEIVLHFVDGQRGDDDLTANGQISDPGAPAFTTNTPPTATDDTPTTDEDTPLIINVLANDSDPQGDPLTLSLATLPTKGIATLNNNGTPNNPSDDTITYTPNPNFNGTDTFTYTLSDGIETTTATVTITINPVDDAPTVENALAPVTVDEDAPNTIIDLSNVFTDVDGDAIALSLFANTNTGLVTATLDGNNLILDYQDNQFGMAEITLRGTAYGEFVANTFTVTVNPVNDAPTLENAIADQNETKGQPFSFAIPANTFSDIDGDALSYSLAEDTILPNGITFESGTFNGTPTVAGTYNLTVIASDPAGETASDTFTLTVANVNSTPTLTNISKSGDEDTAIAFTLTDFIAAFSDPDGNSLTQIQIVTLPGNGILKLSGVAVTEGQEIAAANLANLTFEPDTDFNGNISFSWNGFDGTSYATNPAQVNLTINSVNDAPEVKNAIANQNATEGQRFTFTIPANTFSDIDGDALTYSLAEGTILPDGITFEGGTFSGTPGDTASGTYNLTVIASDPAGETASNTFTLKVLNTVNGSTSSEIVTGTSGDDYINAGAGNDTVNGGEGNDVLDGGTGSDRLVGGPGDDTYIVDNSRDVVIENGGEGKDTIQAFVSYTLPAYVEDLMLTGISNINGTGNDLDNAIAGNSGNNLLKGLGGNDTLNGWAGNDILTGGAGDDILTGGEGADSFLFGSGAAFTPSAFGVDSITDFTKGTDKIALSKASFTALTSGTGGNLQASEFATIDDAADEVSLAGGSTAKIVYNLATGNLFYNQNGATAGLGNGGLFATLNQVNNLEAIDFSIQT
jgi:Ca2+-binding RTX toxin-like protein